MVKAIPKLKLSQKTLDCVWLTALPNQNRNWYQEWGIACDDPGPVLQDYESTQKYQKQKRRRKQKMQRNDSETQNKNLWAYQVLTLDMKLHHITEI